MSEHWTLQSLQAYVRHLDHHPDKQHDYFLKLVEEVGELSKAIQAGKRMGADQEIKGTMEEELYDVLYYVLALANVYEIDLQHCFHLKEAINAQKYGTRSGKPN